MRILLPLLLWLGCNTPAPPIEQPAKPTLTPLSTSKIGGYDASSSLEYKGNLMGPKLAFDGESGTAWCEGARGVKGEWISVTFKAPVRLDALQIEAGLYLNDKTLIKNGRVRTLTITNGSGWTETVDIAYVPERMHSSTSFKVKQTSLPTPPKSQTLKFKIDEADKGHTTSDVCISEIRLLTHN